MCHSCCPVRLATNYTQCKGMAVVNFGVATIVGVHTANDILESPTNIAHI